MNDKDPVAKQVAAALDSRRFEIGIAVPKGVSVSTDLLNAVKNVTKKTPTVLPWLP